MNRYSVSIAIETRRRLSSFGFFARLQVLIEYERVNLTMPDPAYGSTALHWAYANEDLDCIEVSGGEVKLGAVIMQTLFQVEIALAKPHVDLALFEQVLLSNGADPRIECRNRCSGVCPVCGLDECVVNGIQPRDLASTRKRDLWFVHY